MNATLFRNPVALGIGALVALILAVSSFVIVPETEQAVVLRFEQPVYTVNVWQPNEPFGRTGAGLLAKFPFIDKVVWVDKRVLDVDLDNQQVLSTDQLRLEVDAFARFRIVNPLKAVVSTGSSAATEDRIAEQLRPLLGSALRNELGKRPFAALLSPERGQVMDNIQNGLQKLASQYGVQIVDVRIKHADLPDGSPLDSALNRMRTARQQQAATIRAQGQKSAQIIRAEADANASRIYAESFNKDAEFYDFYRAMQSYRQTFGADGSTPQGETSIVLSPNNEYLKQFTGRPR
ncbi:MAG: protease modulator HflC [Sphingomonas sp. 28-62-20]|uniref:protease modulator HflC n=1 Tax=unclassified Sphingomonas TaxID=196159 RepID=UPI000A0E1CDF|nr:protease modulator HflC [Sphingomonas sp.]OQW72137.1 MAG: protease modulator HflC [Proteobacteria bacterium ST_bin13]OYY77424.1 MAG: protease modulator HflC [Sphingomonas sp. 28-62-20]